MWTSRGAHKRTTASSPRPPPAYGGQQGRPQVNNHQLVPYQGGQPVPGHYGPPALEQPNLPRLANAPHNRASQDPADPGDPVIHENQPDDLATHGTEFRALRCYGNRPPLGPERNVRGRWEPECLNYVFDGSCSENCPRRCNHIPVIRGSTRHQNCRSFKLDAIRRWEEAGRPALP